MNYTFSTDPLGELRSQAAPPHVYNYRGYGRRLYTHTAQRQIKTCATLPPPTRELKPCHDRSIMTKLFVDRLNESCRLGKAEEITKDWWVSNYWKATGCCVFKERIPKTHPSINTETGPITPEAGEHTHFSHWKPSLNVWMLQVSVNTSQPGWRRADTGRDWGRSPAYQSANTCKGPSTDTFAPIKSGQLSNPACVHCDCECKLQNDRGSTEVLQALKRLACLTSAAQQMDIKQNCFFT